MSTIQAVLLAAMEGRFPERGMRLEQGRIRNDDMSDIVFPASHPEVGDLIITDDGDEATVFIGEITHSHFNCYDDDLTGEQKAGQIAANVVGFVDALFADRVLLWKALGAGGWKLVEAPAVTAPSAVQRRWLVWSGPLGEAG